MTRIRLMTAAAVLIPLALAGCGGDDPEPKIPETAPTTSSSPSTSPVAATDEPRLPPEAEGNDEAAAEAFVRYYWELVHYAESTGDVRALDDLSLPSCEGCAGGERFIRDMYQQGGYSNGGAYAIEGFKIDTLSKRPGLRRFNTELQTTRAPTVQRASESSNEKRYPENESAVAMSLTWDKTGFSVAASEFL